MTYKEAALKLCDGFLDNPSGCDGCPLATENYDDDGNMICELNDVNDVPMVRHGRWVYDRKKRKAICYHCGGAFRIAYNYCPNCGEKMDLEDENE